MSLESEIHVNYVGSCYPTSVFIRSLDHGSYVMNFWNLEATRPWTSRKMRFD